MLVRDATLADAGAIGRIHVAAWRAAYVGQMPDEYLAEMSEEARSGMWHRIVQATPGSRSVVLVVEDDSGAVVGFANVGPYRGDELSGAGELIAINLAPSAWGTGAGTALHAAAIQRLTEAGYTDVRLWVLPGNARGRRFYEREGWTAEDVTRVDTVMGVEVAEIRYKLTTDD